MALLFSVFLPLLLVRKMNIEEEAKIPLVARLQDFLCVRLIHCYSSKGREREDHKR